MTRLGKINKTTALWPKGHRQCKKCLEVLPLDNFHKHGGCMFGVNTVCKPCRQPLSRHSWQTKDPEYKILTRAKSRARENSLEFDLELEDIVIPTVCPVFKKEFINNHPDWCPSIDRINPEYGYIKNNVQIISNKANRMKSNATKEELKQFAKWVCDV